MQLNQIIDVSRWPRKRKMNVGYGTRGKVVLKQTKWGKVYYMAKTYSKDIGELRSELCASTIGRVFGFPVQKTWFCHLPTLKMFPHPQGVLLQLDVRRQRDTRRNQFKENLIHGADLIGFVDKNFTRLKTQPERRNAYTLEVVIKALRNYVVKNKKATIVWEQFFNLLVFDALIGGTDRHYNNWGILQNADYDTFIRLAPAFDNGISLLWKLSEYAPKFKQDLYIQRFIRKPQAMFKKTPNGKYNLFTVLDAFYDIPELRGSKVAKKIFDRLSKVKPGLLMATMLKNIPQNKEFCSEKQDLLLVCQYAMIRLEMLKNKLLEIDRLYK
jgi:hypothetical protein